MEVIVQSQHQRELDDPPPPFLPPAHASSLLHQIASSINATSPLTALNLQDSIHIHNFIIYYKLYVKLEKPPSH